MADWNLGRVFRVAAAYVVGVYTGNWALLASQISREAGSVKAQKQRRKAIAEYNDSLQNRLEMVDLQPDAPRTLVLGRVRYVEGVRRRWTSGTNDEKLTMIVSFAGHEIDAFESWYLDDMPVTLDGSGWVQEAPYNQTTRVQYNVDGGFLDISGAGSVVLPATPADPAAVHAVWTAGSGDLMTQGACSVSVVGATVTITSGEPYAAVWVTYTGDIETSHVRIRPYLGASGQNVGDAIDAEYPGKITSTDKFSGMACAVVDVIYNPDIFPQGRPNVTAVMRGAKCYDPRTTTTVWTDNPALHALCYATEESGWNLESSDYVMADVTAAANACDVSTVFPLSTGNVTMTRYRCGITISSAADHAEAMDAIMETMAGRHGWAGGKWRFRAGTLGSTATTITRDWLVNENSGGRPGKDPVITAVQAVPRTQRINRVTGSCIDPSQRYQLLPFPAVEDSTLVGLYGQRALEVEFQGVDHIAHAQHLCSMAIRQAQAGLRLEIVVDERGAKLELFDVVALTMARYGFSAKTFEVIGWTWQQAGAYKIQLAEITAALFTVDAALSGRDPAPDSDIRAPWDVEAIAGLAVDSDVTALQDGSIITRAQVTWTAATGENIRQGGSIEIQYTEAAADLPAGDWPSWIEQGNSAATVIPGLLSGRHYLFRVRAVQQLPLVRGPWSDSVLHEMAALPVYIQKSLDLQHDSFAFLFDPPLYDTTTSPDIVITAVLNNITGTPVFTLTAYAGGGVSLGSVTPTTTSTNVRTLTPAQFQTHSGTYYVRVLCEVTEGATTYTDEITIFRGDNGSNTLNLWLGNEMVNVPSDADGSNPVFTNATTQGVRVYEGTTDVTSLWTIARADTNVTSTINGGAGPVSGTGTVDVAVTAMSAAFGYVTITATRTDYPTQTAYFKVLKAYAGADGLVHRLTRDQVIVPVYPDGTVSSWGDAVTTFYVEQGALDISADWTFTYTSDGVVVSQYGAANNFFRVTDFSSAAAGDSDFSSVTLLMHFNGTDGDNSSLAFVDSSNTGVTFTRTGNARLEADQSKWGGTSLYLPDTNAGLYTANYAGIQFGTGDFTIEFWIWRAGSTGGDFLPISCRDSSGTNRWAIDIGASGNIAFLVDSTTYAISSTALATSAWAHVAFSRKSGTIRTFINGTQRGSATLSTDLNNTGSSLRIGDEPTLSGFTATYLEDLRITKGVGRYDADFTAPTAPYPDTGGAYGPDPTEGYVDITAARTGFVSVVKRFSVVKGISPNIVSAYVYPSSASVPATADGIVTSYAGAAAEVTVLVDGVDDTANWTFVTTPSTGVTISGDDTASIAVTAMTDAIESGYVDIVASKANYDDEVMRFVVFKAKNGIPSGIRAGANYGAINVTGEYIAIKFLRNGQTQVKRTSGGSYVDIGSWSGLIQTTIGDGYYLKVVNSGDAFTSGATVGSYLQLNTDREFIFESSTPGTYTMDLKVYIATSSGGADAVIGFGLLELEVP